MKRAFSPLHLAALCWLLVALISPTRRGLLRAWNAGESMRPLEDGSLPAAIYAGDARRYAADRRAQLERLSRPGSLTEAELEAAAQRWKDDPTAIAMLLRARLNRLQTDHYEGVLSNPRGPDAPYPPPSSSRPPGMPPETTSPRAQWDSFIALARRGQALEPGNSFFRWMTLYGLFATRRDDAARVELALGARQGVYDDHNRDIILNRLALMRQFSGGPLSPRENLGAWAATIYPELGKTRQVARWAMESAIADRAAGLHRRALDTAFQLAQMGRVMRRSSYSMIGSLVGGAVEGIAIQRVTTPPPLSARAFVRARSPRFGMPLAAYQSSPISLYAYTKAQNRADILAFLNREWTEIGKWRAMSALIINGTGNSPAQTLALTGAERIQSLLLRALPWVVIWGALFGGLARRYRDDSDADLNGFWRGAWCALGLLTLALGFDLFLSLREASASGDWLGYLDSRGLMGTVPSWVTMGIAGVTALLALGAATMWQKRQVAPPIPLGTRLQTAFDAPEDGLMRFDFSWIFGLVARSTLWLLLFGAFAAVCFDVGQIGRRFGFDVPNIGGAMMAASLLLSLFLHARTWWSLPRRRDTLRLGARLVAQAMRGFFVAASVLYALVAFGFLPLAYRYERNFEQAMKRGEAQIARASLGLK